MREINILDTGPLVAYFDRRDPHHAWARDVFAAHVPAFVTCEPVITEACFLLARGGGDPLPVLRALQAGFLKTDLEIQSEAAALETLMKRYSDTPMSLADACLVRLPELHRACRIFTLDRDFTTYRRHGRSVIPLLSPW